MKNKVKPFIHGLFASFILFLALLFLENASAQTNNNNNATLSTMPLITPSLVKKIETPGILKSFVQKFNLNYYMQVLGPSPALPSNQTYNVFIESKSPLQMFHAAGLVYQLPKNFAISATFAGITHFSESVKTETGKVENESLLFNPRLNMILPGLRSTYATFYHTLGYEFSANTLSREDEMKRGYVLSQSIAFSTPVSSNWSFGLLSQVIRYEYESNVKPAPCTGCFSIPLQTLIASTGPYVNYRISDKWMVYNIVTFDWDQRGEQTGTTNFNNNLPDRFRLGIKYFPQKPLLGLGYVGLFTQGLLKTSSETTVIGADLSFRL
jgi:hypothetical protein